MSMTMSISRCEYVSMYGSVHMESVCVLQVFSFNDIDDTKQRIMCLQRSVPLVQLSDILHQKYTFITNQNGA